MSGEVATAAKAGPRHRVSRGRGRRSDDDERENSSQRSTLATHERTEAIQLRVESIAASIESGGTVLYAGRSMGNVNRKATKAEMAHARQEIEEAFPDFEAVFGGHGNYGGHRAPRDHTISFRLRDRMGKYRSNVVWIMQERLGSLTAGEVRWLVDQANGK